MHINLFFLPEQSCQDVLESCICDSDKKQWSVDVIRARKKEKAMVWQQSVKEED